MKCPTCKEAIREDISFRKKPHIFCWKYYKVYTFFCPMCEIRREIDIEISRDNYGCEMKQLYNGGEK